MTRILVERADGIATLWLDRADKRKSGVVPADDSNEGMTVGFLPVPIKRITVLAAIVKVLVPDVREIVLIELKRSVDRNPVIDTGPNSIGGSCAPCSRTGARGPSGTSGNGVRSVATAACAGAAPAR